MKKINEIYFLFLLKNYKKEAVIRRDLEKNRQHCICLCERSKPSEKKESFFMIEKYSFK